ncbi:hypothetical protein JB92DRAFT_548421 [Gautieria morchelliformis]|nr:hypothetical protein JB92DRAFT_548421 [Gautieria morchelliformis]
MAALCSLLAEPPVHMQHSCKAAYVIVLDGGDIQSLCSLALMRRVDVVLGNGLSPQAAVSVKPSDYFDLIVGTGTTVSVPCYSCVYPPR